MKTSFFTAKKTQLFIAFLLALGTNLYAQPGLTDGLIPDDEEYLTVPFDEFLRDPRTPIGDHKSLLDKSGSFPVKFQGEGNGCVGYAIAAATALRLNRYCKDYCSCQKDWQLFSATYIYNQVKDPATGCASMKRSLDTLVSQGICMESDFKNNITTIPTKSHRRSALTYKIWQYRRIFRLPSEFAQHPDTLLLFKRQIMDNAISAIIVGRPVLVGAQITPDFKLLSPENCLWTPPDTLGLVAWHALVLVGYDNRTKKFTLLNSYGAGWGCGGMVRVSYDDFCRIARFGYTLSIIPPFGGKVDCGK